MWWETKGRIDLARIQIDVTLFYVYLGIVVKWFIIWFFCLFVLRNYENLVNALLDGVEQRNLWVQKIPLSSFAPAFSSPFCFCPPFHPPVPPSFPSCVLGACGLMRPHQCPIRNYIANPAKMILSSAHLSSMGRLGRAILQKIKVWFTCSED